MKLLHNGEVPKNPMRQEGIIYVGTSRMIRLKDLFILFYLFSDFPRVVVGPENPLRVERDGTASLQCSVDAKPKVSSVRWTRNGRFIGTAFSHSLLRVGVMDAGKYTCSAENGLGENGEAEILLDVLYAPTVTIEATPGAARHREAEEGESVTVKCNVSANPAPYIVEWLREGHPGFRQSGEILRFVSILLVYLGRYLPTLYSKFFSSEN